MTPTVRYALKKHTVHEYGIAARLLGLDQRGIADLARTAVESSFRDDAGKRELLAEIDAYTADAG